MPADRLLVTLLRALQSHTNQQDTPRLLSTSTSLLTTLSNPRNLSLLTAQLLTAPALWTKPPTLQSCLRFFGTFQSAAMILLKHEDDVAENPEKSQIPPGQPVIGGNLSRDEWVRAVLSGADDRSPRWRHALVLGGLFLGFEARNQMGLQGQLRRTVGGAVVTAVHAALEEVRLGGEEEGAHAAVLVLNYCFDLLDDRDKTGIDYDHLLPAILSAAFFSKEGYRSGYFFATVNQDVLPVSGKILTWSPRSISFQVITDITAQPLITNMGPLSRLIAHTTEQLKDAFLIQTMMDDLVEYSKTIFQQWRWTKLSGIDPREEGRYLDEATMSKTLPVLWKLLRSNLFAISVILRSVAGRILGDRTLGNDAVAPVLAKQMLHIIRNLYFISSRHGSNMLTQHTFVYLTAIDILSAYPRHVDSFTREIRPTSPGKIPSDPLERNLDLFFLNTVEHFTFVLPPEMNEDLLMAATTPYLATGENTNLLEIFEAAHSVTLAVFSAPQNAQIAASHVPFYVDTLFKVFPQSLSQRQFRLAFKTLVRITTPPSLLAASHPDLPEILLELVHHRVCNPPLLPRPAPYTAPDAAIPQTTLTSPTATACSHSSDPEAGIDVRTALVLTLIDSLPCLPLHMLDEWLPRTAELIPELHSNEARQSCRQRFWEAVSDGEMDVERSQLCVAWWGTAGGREMVMREKNGADVMMSGALRGSML